MAGDIRDNPKSRGPPPGATEAESDLQSPKSKVYEVFTNSPPSSSPPSSSVTNPSPTGPKSANALPAGSAQNTAGSIGRKEAPTLTEAIKTLRVEDFKQVHMYPCVRESLLLGIGAGFGIGGVRAFLGAPIARAANWAVGAFVFGTLGNYEYCSRKRSVERGHIKRAVEVMDRKKAAKEAEAQRKKEEVERVEEEKKRNRNGWKFW